MKTKDKSVLSSLSNQFAAVATKVAKGHIAYAFPKNLKKLALSAAFMMVVQPMTGVLFPTAEEYGQRLNVPEKMVTDITGGKPTYIRSGALGRASQVYDMPLFFSIPMEVLRTASSYHDVFKANASAKPATSLGGLICRVNMMGEDTTTLSMHDLLAQERIIHEDKLSRDPLPQQFVTDLKRFIYLHELRHCNNANMAKDLKEADADYHAIKGVETLNPNTQIRDFVVNFRAVGKNGKHSHSLQLTALLSGQQSDETDMKNANKEAMLYLKEHKRGDMRRYLDMTPLAQKRVDMYYESMRFFYKFAPQPQTSNKQTTQLVRGL